MSVQAKGRSTMALYSSSESIECHRVRFVLAEKGINVEIVNVDKDESAAADLAELADWPVIGQWTRAGKARRCAGGGAGQLES